MHARGKTPGANWEDTRVCKEQDLTPSCGGYNGAMAETARLAEGEAPSLLRRCARVLDAGGLLILPTDTVYGLAARADLEEAVRAAFSAKGREGEKALVIMVPGAREAASLAAPAQRRALGRLSAFWPGPLTVVVEAAEAHWRGFVAPASGSLGIRVPDDPFLLALLALRWPLAVTSANFAGGRAPSSFGEIDEALLAAADLALDGGPRGSGRPSTVAELRGDAVSVLREGDIGLHELRRALAGGGP